MNNTPKFKKLVIKPISEVQPVPLMEKVWVFLFTLFILFITKFNGFINSFADKVEETTIKSIAVETEPPKENEICRYCCMKVDNPFIRISTCIHESLRPVHSRCFTTFHDFEFSCNLCELEDKEDCKCETPIECECKTELPESPLGDEIEGLEVIGIKKEILPCDCENILCEHDYPSEDETILSDGEVSRDIQEYLKEKND